MISQVKLALAILSAASSSTLKTAAAAPTTITTEAPAPLPIAVGYFGYPCAGCYNAQRVAWQFPSPDTSDPLYADACVNHTSISTLTLGSGGFQPPICGSPFDLGGVTGLTLGCREGTGGSGMEDVVAIYDSEGGLYETCSPVTQSQELCGPTGYSGAIQQYVVCQ